MDFFRTEAGESWIGGRQPDPALFFSTPALDRLYELLHHLVENTPKPVLVSGEAGAGKTTLAYRIQADVPEHWRFCRINANPMLHPDQLFNELARCIGAAPDQADMPNALMDTFGRVRLQGALPVVLVDDADLLPLGSLIALLRLHELQADGLPIFSLLFFATPKIESILNNPRMQAIVSAPIKHMRLPALEPGQVAGYIRHFLRVEGVARELELQPEQIERAYQSSGGVPGQVNDWVMQRLRRSPEQRPTRRWIPGLAPVVARPKLKYLLGVLAAVPLLLILLNQDAINRLFSPDPADTRPERGAPLADNDDDAAESTVVTLPLPPPAPVVEEPLIPPEAAEDARSSPAEPPVANAPEQRPAESPLPEAEPQPAPAAARSSTDAEPPAQTASDASVVADVAAGTDVEAPQPPAEPEPQPPPEPEPAVAERFEDRGWRKEAWLLRQSPTAYSLQILGVSDEAAMQRFIRRSGVKNGLMYFQSVRNDRPWYSLLYGLYDNRQLAAAAIERLPKALRKPGIWPRALKAVQQEIRERPR